MNTRPALKEIQCPNCGAALAQYSPDAQSLVCPKCGTMVAIGIDAPEAVGKQPKLPAPPVPVRVGQTATFDGVEFMVLGRVLYEGWDDEDRWRWNEWQLGGADGRMLWLSYDETGFALFSKMRLKMPFNPMTDRYLPLGKLETGKTKVAPIHENYPAKILGAEGELSWRATRGEALHMAEGATGGKKYSAQKTSEELEVYEGEWLPELKIAEAFRDEAWVKKAKARVGMGQMMGVLGLVLLLFGMAGLVGAAWATNSGEIVLRQVVTLSTSNPILNVPVIFDQALRPAVITAKVSAALPDNTAVDVDFTITGPDDSETFLFTNELWSETGYDDEGFWREVQTDASQMFVPLDAGQHDLEIEMGETLGIDSVAVEIIVRRNHVMPVWLVVYGVVFVSIGGALFFFSFMKK